MGYLSAVWYQTRCLPAMPSKALEGHGILTRYTEHFIYGISGIIKGALLCLRAYHLSYAQSSLGHVFIDIAPGQTTVMPSGIYSLG
jgi:hypothetical protein